MLESNLVKRTVKHDMVSPVGRGFDRVTAFFIFYHALSRAFKTHGTLIGVTMSKKDQFIANMQAAEHRGAGETGAPDTPVHAQETTVPGDTPHGYRAFVVSGCRPDIDYNRSVYEAIDDRDGKHRAATFGGCRSSAWFVRHTVTGEIRVAAARCRLRWCPLCIRTKSFVMVQSIIPWLKKARKPKFLTFTLKHSEAPLEFQIKALYTYFKSIRRRPAFKRRVKGGVWFFQIKKSANDGLWHPHIHLLCEGSYFPKQLLSDMWRDVTHGSFITDIRAVRNPRKAANYVARYASAPCRLSDLDFDSAVECVDSLHGRRICGTFGSGRDIKLTPDKCENPGEWEFLETFGKVMLTRHNCEWSSEIYKAWIQERPCYAAPDPPPKLPDDIFSNLEEKPIAYKQLIFEWNN